ncbi:sugar phosphate isomerase/epimerase family protein [Fimbriimonas ginsengisoli]|uniref:Xylose isomerase domain-containing protein n=1 Tax=Fimbriimonas ginsengisoli Gsoil 348 TaxID=661478 RepID=A0A068NPV0_FIMGI|nr:sugar phosphate isomerase/epimerase [Fimbriimonas ginsengisoli]AIE84795.1 xylose isomerase domain-containing protein [Fimbriimonas ginsengisoli Gsoil 348]
MRLSVQLYTLRDALSQDLPGTLAKVREIGLEYVELAGTYDRSADEWKALLAKNGLTASGSHIGIDALSSDLDAVIADAKTIGFKYVILPWIGNDVYADGWEKVAKRLEPIGRKLKEAGLTLAYHNHAFEFENGGLDTFYTSADADLVKAQLDLAWVQIGGADPAAYIRKYAGRVPLVHLKDFDPALTPQWRPAGEGKVDWDGVLAACQEVGVEFGSLELDESPIDPIEAVRKSFDYFHAKGLR